MFFPWQKCMANWLFWCSEITKQTIKLGNIMLRCLLFQKVKSMHATKCNIEIYYISPSEKDEEPFDLDLGNCHL